MKVLDLFCGAGGSAVGIHRALPEAEIIGVDNRFQKHYPFTFVLADAMNPPFDLREFDFIWASPPCQRYSEMQKIHHNETKHPDLVDPVRRMLRKTRVPYVIENVEGAPLDTYFRLCGSMFGLGVPRHRLFESNARMPILVPPCSHDGKYDPYHGGEDARGERTKMAGAMGIDWTMTRPEVRQAIPPAYSEFIVRQIFPPAK